MSNTSFNMSQDYEIVPPKKQKAYPILIEEWALLKRKIRLITEKVNLYHTIGSVLLGVSGSAFIAAITFNIPQGEPTPVKIVVSWCIFAFSLISGLLSMHFGGEQRKVQSSTADEIVSLMELIEKRYTIFEKEKS